MPSVQDNFHSTHDYVAFFAEFPAIRFTNVSGGDLTMDGQKVYSGGARFPRNINGPANVTDVTVTKPAEDIVDAPIRAWAAAFARGVVVPLTLVVQRITPAGLPAPGAPVRTYLRCAFRTIAAPPMERGSANAAILSITIAPEERQG